MNDDPQAFADYLAAQVAIMEAQATIQLGDDDE